MEEKFRDIKSRVVQLAALRDKLEQDKEDLLEKLKDGSIPGREHLHAHLLELHTAAASHTRAIMTYMSALENLLGSQRPQSHQQQAGKGPYLLDPFSLHCNMCECAHYGPLQCFPRTTPLHRSFLHGERGTMVP